VTVWVGVVRAYDFTGVVLLHLLLIPGTGFLTGGVHVLHQHLDPHQSQLNQSLLIIGYEVLHLPFNEADDVLRSVMSLVVPTAFFTSLNRTGEVSAAVPNTNPITDVFRGDFLRMARGVAVLLLLV
jgi:Ca2+:H+ antiporter